MMELETGLTGRAQHFYRRHHTLVVTAVLSVTGIATGTAAAITLHQALAIQNALLFVLSTALALLPVFYLTRHWTVAALTVLAPLPGLIWAAPVASGSNFAAIPFLAYGFGLVAAVFCSEDRLASLLEARPFKSSLRPMVGAVVLMVLAGALRFRGTHADAVLQVFADTALVLLSVVLLLPLMLSLIHFDEDFVMRANRAREARGRWLEGLAWAATPRWGLSLTGIAAVLTTLGWYGAKVPFHDPQFLGAIFVIVMATGWVAGGGWREGLAFALAMLTAAMLALWAFAIDPRLPEAGVVTLQIASVAVALALCGFSRVRFYRYRGEMPEGARGRVLEEAGGPIAAILGLALAVLVQGLVYEGTLALLFCVAVAWLSGTLLAPAVVTGIETLFPRRRSLEELYGRKRSSR